MSDQSNSPNLFDEIHILVTARAQGDATPEQSERLKQLLTENEAARTLYVRYIQETVALRKMAAGDHASTRSVSEANNTNPAEASLTLWVSRPHSPFRLSRLAIAALVAFVAIGILAYDTFWFAPHDPVVKQTPANVPAAKIANLTDAKWDSTFSPAVNSVLASGQRLILQSGSAQITFNNQARVMLEGPAELTIIDAAACRLSAGKLTAHVPDPAKGFKVHTPDGTVTDLGTEFAVYVRSEAGGGRLEEVGEEEQQPGGGPQFDGKQPRVTEVHVFKGKVDVVPGDQLVQAPADANQKSRIIFAGEAITISENKVQPLPAADPFKFALDKLAGQPRAVLLSEDFESYDEGKQINAVGQWIIQSGIRKGQGVSVSDLTKVMADSNAIKLNPSFAPPPAIGVRSVVIAASAQNPKETFPLLAREIDGRQLGGTCQVLIEFDLMPSGQSVQPSLALASDVGHTAGIELWHDADPAVAPVDWTWNQPYRVRVLLEVENGTVRAARVQRSQWRGQVGWVSDRTFHPPIPKLDWTTPPRYAIFGYPVVTAATPATHFWLDNIRIEVISEK